MFNKLRQLYVIGAPRNLVNGPKAYCYSPEDYLDYKKGSKKNAQLSL